MLSPGEHRSKRSDEWAERGRRGRRCREGGGGGVAVVEALSPAAVPGGAGRRPSHPRASPDRVIDGEELTSRPPNVTLQLNTPCC